MATHDYIISNASGAAVRADLNNALAAIATNNSSATAPTTTYAYQWWADTGSSPTVMKLRNAANSAWITLFQLDGEWSNIAFENGSAAAPSIYFKDSGTDTGIYSPGADQVAITTGGTGRLFVDAIGNVGVGSSSPDKWSDANVTQGTFKGTLIGAVNIEGNRTTTSDVGRLAFWQTTNRIAYIGAERAGADNSGALRFITTNAGSESERMRLDSSGRLGIGTTTVNTVLHVASSAPYIRIQDNDSSTASTAQGGFEMYDSDGDRLFFLANDSSSSADVSLFNNAGGALKFGTSGSERGQFDSSGRLLVGTSTAFSQYSAGFQLVNNSGSGIDCGRFDNSASSSDVILTKGRGGSVGTRGIVSNNDQLGQIGFKGDDGSTLNSYAATITAFVDGTPGTNDMPGRLVFSVTEDGTATPVERVRLGNQGRLDVYSSSGTVVVSRSICSASTGCMVYEGFYGATSTTTGTLSYRVFSNGNVVNTNSSYGALSDIKLKENIVDAGSQWADLKALRVRKYNLKEGQTHTQIGLIAQEAELVSPGLVYETPDRDEEGNDTGEITKVVQYSILYMKAVKALQEAMERIEQLETEMAEVKAQLQAS